MHNIEKAKEHILKMVETTRNSEELALLAKAYSDLVHADATETYAKNPLAHLSPSQLEMQAAE